jgi:hypothetical protein
MTRDDADKLVSQMKALVTTEWEHEIRAQGGSVADCAAVQSAFVPPGFEFAA